jgi:DNA repair exonuclease SbcCD nuclease subunit
MEEGTGAVKLGIVADVHLDQAFTWAGPDIGRKLRQAIRDALRNAVRAVYEVGADALCVAGDLFEDDRYSSDTPEFLRGLFADPAAVGQQCWASRSAS